MAKNKDNQPTASSNKAKKRKRQQKLRNATLPLASLPEALRQHIQVLQLDSTADYLDWCRQNGFVCGIYKTWEQLRVERLHALRGRAEARVRKARSVRRPDRILRQIVEGRVTSRDEVPDALVPIHELLVTGRMVSSRVPAPAGRRKLARRLIRHLLNVCPDLLFEAIGSGGPAEDVYLLAILRLTRHWEYVCREVEAWRPRSYNSRRRFTSLARHLFARYPVPLFLDHAWFDAEPQGAEHRRWFVLVGAGVSLRTAGALPRWFTRRMVHWFLEAPARYTIVEGLRFGQVLAMGGDPRLVEALRGTPLCRELDTTEAGQEVEGFWASVLRFFIRHQGELDPAHVHPILDYLQHQRFEHREAIDDEGRVHREAPPQPNLSMKGRTLESLLRQVRDWHRRLGLASGEETNVTWPPCGIVEFRSVEGDAGAGKQRTWTVRELTSGGQLVAEGRKMRHCVASYAGLCRTGQTSIWSLQVEQDKDKGPIRMLTIQVDIRRRRIIQARGRDNRGQTDLGRKVMARWAAAAGLTIARWL